MCGGVAWRFCRVGVMAAGASRAPGVPSRMPLLFSPILPLAQEFAREALTQLRSLLGLAAARRRLIQHNDLYAANGSSTSNKAGSSSTSTGSNSNGRGSNVPPPVGRIDVLTDLRSGLAPWEADALVRRRTRADVAAAAATLGSLARLLRQVPTLALPPAAGALVRDAVAALRRALAAVEAGSYVEASQ